MHVPDEEVVPPGWKKIVSQSRGQAYYLNIHTKKSQWDPPTKAATARSSSAGEGPPTFKRSSHLKENVKMWLHSANDDDEACSRTQSPASFEDGVLDPVDPEASLAQLVSNYRGTDFFKEKQAEDLEPLTGESEPINDLVAESSKSDPVAADVSEFQPASLISKVRKAYRLKSHLGVTSRTKKYVDMDMDDFRAMIRDRTQGLKLVQKISQYFKQLKGSEVKLGREIEERRKIVETSEMALVFYENVRGEAKIVNGAYKNLTTMVMGTSEKVDETIMAFDEMEGTFSPVPSPLAAEPSPLPGEEQFGVQPANKCDGTYSSSTLPSAAASYIEVIQPNNTNEIPIDPMSEVNPEHLYLSNANSSYTSPSTTAMNSHPLTVNPSEVSLYNPSQSNPYEPITSMQQQFQQAWSTGAMAETYAGMSMPMALPNFMQQFQQQSMPIMSTGYGVQMQPPPQQQSFANIDYETYQLQSDHQHASPPLPPTPDISLNPPQPPPPLPEEAPPPEQSNPYAASQPPPPPGNPFGLEYDPIPMYSHNSSFSEPTGYDPARNPYNKSRTPSPVDTSPPSRYHPYDNHSPRGSGLSDPWEKWHSMGEANNSLTSVYPPVNNTSPTGTGTQILPLMEVPVVLSPMEMFSQLLRKHRGIGTINNSIPESVVSNASGDWSALKEDTSQSNSMQSQNPFCNINTNNNPFTGFTFDNGQGRQEGRLNGNETGAERPNIWEMSNNNPFDLSHPSLLQPSNRVMNRGKEADSNHRGRGGARGTKHTNTRGLRGAGGNRDGHGSQNSGGVGRGPRGRGVWVLSRAAAGPPHARGRGRF